MTMDDNNNQELEELVDETIKASSGEGNVLAGFVLFKDANMDWLRFKKVLDEDWGITFDDEIKDNAVVFKVDDMMVACSLLPMPVPNDEATEAARRNILWADGAKLVSEHQAHMVVAVMNKFDAIEQQVLLAKVISSMLKLDNTIGVYKAPTVFEKDFYIRFAESIKQGEYPMPIFIYVGMYNDHGGVCAFTSGLNYFGKPEIEVVGSQSAPEQVLSFMYSISEYVLVEDADLKDGETIGFTEDQKLPITVSDGVSLTGQTVKIGF